MNIKNINARAIDMKTKELSAEKTALLCIGY